MSGLISDQIKFLTESYSADPHLPVYFYIGAVAIINDGFKTDDVVGVYPREKCIDVHIRSIIRILICTTLSMTPRSKSTSLSECMACSVVRSLQPINK